MADLRFISLAHYQDSSCMLFSVEEFQQLKYYGLKFGVEFHKPHKN